MRVRPAQARDSEAIRDILDHPISRAFSPESAHQATESAICYVIESEDRVLGFCRFDPHEDGGYELSMLVHPEHHNKGFGSFLLDGSLKELSSGTRIRVEVVPNNGAALAFLMGRGFTHIGRTEHADVLEMVTP
ncbi:GNAT family N-acetyltransferase [Patescibacteria group bacterium]|jgi:ribosomal-protein-alanine N-acetyltransferase|nr:GNAT family N-acetyltransferase [Patescibacteria group bacterium]